MRTIVFASLLTLAAALPLASQEQTGDERLPFLVEAAVPSSVGSPELTRRLLNPPVGRQLSESFEVRNLEKLVDDKLPPNPCVKLGGRCTLENEKGSALRLDLGRGRVRYSNRERSQKKEPIALPPGPCIDLARKTAAAFGIPAAELGTPDFRYLQLTSAGEGDTRTGRGVTLRAEGHVRFGRQIGGIPVAFSKFFVAADARGKVARANARWQDFRLAPGLSPSQALSRQAVVAAIVEELSPALRPGTTARIVANVVYSPADLLERGENGEDHPPDTDLQGTFVPALLVTVVPVEQAENSGVTQMPAQNLVFPLLGVPPDDGIAR